MSARKSKILAVIPARAGSKRLKNKNVLSLYGKPMMAYTIEAALKSGIFEDVLVSTDEEKIAKVARHYGAVVPFLRDKRLSDDHSPVSIATIAAVEQMQRHTGRSYDTVVQLMPNCPCRSGQDIRRAYAQFIRLKMDYQISVSAFGWMNPWWALQLNAKTMRVRPVFPESLKRRSQDLGSLYCPSGAIWIAKADALKKAKTFYGKDYGVFVMDWQHALDIDDEDDLALTKIVMGASYKHA